MERYEELEKEITKIKDRNVRVEMDKAWEMSFERRTMIAVGIYIGAIALLTIIRADNAIWGAIIPVFGYIISTLTLPFLKEQWMKRRMKEIRQK